MLDNTKLDELLRVLYDAMSDNSELYELPVVLCHAMTNSDKFDDKFFFATLEGIARNSIEACLRIARFFFLLPSATGGHPPRGRESLTIHFMNTEPLRRNILITASGHLN
jgi:hypothetical protein